MLVFHCLWMINIPSNSCLPLPNPVKFGSKWISLDEQHSEELLFHGKLGLFPFQPREVHSGSLSKVFPSRGHLQWIPCFSKASPEWMALLECLEKKNKSFQLLEKEFFPTKLFQFLGIYNPIQCFSLFLFPKLFPESVSHPVWPRLFPCPISGGAWRGKVGFEGDLWILAVFFQGCSGIFDLGGEAGQLCRFLLWLRFPACQSRKC